MRVGQYLQRILAVFLNLYAQLPVEWAYRESGHFYQYQGVDL